MKRRWAIAVALPAGWFIMAGLSGALAIWLGFLLGALAWPRVAAQAREARPRFRLVACSALLSLALPAAWLLAEGGPALRGGGHDLWEFAGATTGSLALLYGGLIGLPQDGRARRIVGRVAIGLALAAAILALLMGIGLAFVPST